MVRTDTGWTTEPMDTPGIQSKNTTLVCRDYIDVAVDMDVVVKPVEWLRPLTTASPLSISKDRPCRNFLRYIPRYI